MSNKKAQGISLNYIIIAIIALLVLAVIIFIFRAQIGKVFGVFTSIGQKAGCEAEIATSALGGLFGRPGCEENTHTCKGGCEYECRDNKLVLIAECSEGCANKEHCPKP